VSGYRRQGRARKRDLRARRLALEPGLRSQRQLFRERRRELRARAPRTLEQLFADVVSEIDRKVLSS
jgi:hypothetical protein